jgi:FkbM family methyltransferase
MPALRHRAAHFLLKKLGMFNRSYKERIEGRQFVVPIINGRKTYASEPWMTEMIRRLFDQGPGAFIDVGVNLGQTMLKVAAVDPDREYLGFEPNPSCADYAFELIKANAFPYVVIPAALSAGPRVSRLELYRDETTDPSASLVAGFRENAAGTKPVVTVSLDDLPSSFLPKQVAIVKIDVEGGEADVIESIEPLLTAQRPFVLMEILPAYSSANEPRLGSQRRIESAITRANYSLFRIHRDRKEHLDHLERLSEIGIHGDLALSDYLVAPSERADSLKDSFKFAP